MPTYILLSGIGITGIVIACMIFVALIVFLGIFLYKKKFHSTSKFYFDTYNECHSTLTISCKKMLDRIDVLGKNNESFYSAHGKKLEQYKEINEKRDEKVKNLLKSLEQAIKAKNRSKIKELEKKCATELESFRIAVGNLSTDLNAILQDDNDIHSNSVNVKGKYRQIKTFYEENENELKSLEPSFNKIFSTAELKFGEFDNYADLSQFDKAKEILDELNKLFDAVLDVMDELPKLAVIIETIIPKKIEEVLSTYHEMLNEDYVLYDMKIEEKTSKMNETLELMKEELGYFDVKHVKEQSSEIQNEIVAINVGFNKEKNAKSEYLSKCNTLSGSSFSVAKRYSRLTNQLDEYSRVYKLNDEYVQKLTGLSAHIEVINNLKISLDSYVETTNRRPYVVIFQKMTEMDEEMKNANKVMDEYQAYLENLKNSANEIYQGLRQAYSSLKDAHNLVNEINLPSFTSSVEPTFASYYQNIDEINGIISALPIDLDQAKNLYEPFKDTVNGFIVSIQNKHDECDKAEKNITLANAYRTDYIDSRTDLEDASNAFFNSDFNKASRLATRVVNTFKAANNQ